MREPEIGIEDGVFGAELIHAVEGGGRVAGQADGEGHGTAGGTGGGELV